jgi:ABC-2 type transport system permease protein
MPIYDQGYRRYEARGPLRRVRFWPISREALRLLLSRRAYIGLLVMAWIPFIVHVVIAYVTTRFPDARRVVAVDAAFFGGFFRWQMIFTLLLSVFGGAGLIANDLRTGAILVYLSRPLDRRDYILGKLGVLMTLNLSVTLVPGLLLYLIALALAPDQLATMDLAWIGPAIVFQSIVISLVTSLVALAVSALSKSARVAGIGFFILMIGLELVRSIVFAVYNRPEALLISIRANMQALGNALFGISARGMNLPWFQPALALALVALGCLAILRARVRAVEIVR